MSIVEQLIDVATDLARKRGHGRVAEAHVLAAVLQCTTLTPELMQTVSIARLERHLLAPFDVGHGYRDVRPVLDPGLRAWIQRARPSGLAGFLDEPRAIDVLERYLATADLDAFKWNPAPIKKLYDATTKLMTVRRHNRALIDHALVALAARKADDGRFADAIARLGHDPQAVRVALRERITARTVSLLLATLPRLVTFSALLSNAARRSELGVDFIVVDFLRKPQARIALEAAGVDRDALLYSYMHGRAPAPAVMPEHGPAEIVFHDDDFTTQEAVATVLEKHFDLAPDAARAFMLEVHQNGHASLPAPPDASSRIAAAQAMLRGQGMALRIELVPSSSSGAFALAGQ